MAYVFVPRVNVICLASGVQFGKASASVVVLVICFLVPFERFKTHKSPEAITANRSPSGVAATSVSMPSMSTRRLRRGTSNVLWLERVALKKYQTVVRRVAAMTKGTIGNRIRSRACYYTRSLDNRGSSRLRFFCFLVLANLLDSPIIRDGLFDIPARQRLDRPFYIRFASSYWFSVCELGKRRCLRRAVT